MDFQQMRPGGKWYLHVSASDFVELWRRKSSDGKKPNECLGIFYRPATEGEILLAEAAPELAAMVRNLATELLACHDDMHHLPSIAPVLEAEILLKRLDEGGG